MNLWPSEIRLKQNLWFFFKLHSLQLGEKEIIWWVAEQIRFNIYPSFKGRVFPVVFSRIKLFLRRFDRETAARWKDGKNKIDEVHYIPLKVFQMKFGTKNKLWESNFFACLPASCNLKLRIRSFFTRKTKFTANNMRRTCEISGFLGFSHSSLEPTIGKYEACPPWLYMYL